MSSSNMGEKFTKNGKEYRKEVFWLQGFMQKRKTLSNPDELFSC